MYLHILIFFLFLNLLIEGQEKSDSIFTTKLDSIFVSATRYEVPLSSTPFSISTLTSIDSNEPTSLDDIFTATSGIEIKSRYNFSQGDNILLRGIGTRSAFGVKGTKIFLDGIPLTFTDGQSQLNNLDVSNIAKVEILKGPSSTLYGNSLGGTIHFSSKEFREDKITFIPQLTYGSFGFHKYGFNSSIGLFNGSLSLGGYSLKSDGFREHSEAKNYGANLNFKTELSDKILFRIVSNYFHSPYLLNPSSLNKYDSENNPQSVRSSVKTFSTGKKISQFQNSINIKLLLSDKSKINTTLYAVRRSLKNSIPRRIIDLQRFFYGSRIEFENEIKLFDNDFFTLIGFDYESQNDERKEFLNGGIDSYSDFNPENLFENILFEEQLINQNESVKSLGLFSHINFNISKHIKVFGGLRFDNYSFTVEEKLNSNTVSKIDNNNYSGMLGFSHKLNSSMIVYGNYSTGFQTPTTNELSNNPLREGGFNKKLDPEKLNNYEIGLRGWSLIPQIFYNISLFKMDISKMLIPYQLETEETYYRNAGKASNHGIEMDFEILLSTKLRIKSSYNYMNFLFTDYIVQQGNSEMLVERQLKNNSVPGVPKNSFSLFTQYNLLKNLFTELSYNWVDKYFTNDYNGSFDGLDKIENYINEAYSVLHFSIVYNYKYDFLDVGLKFSVKNIFNKKYNDSIVPNAFGNNYFEPAPGRNVFLNLFLKI